MKIKSFPKISFYSIILIGIIALTGFIAYANILNSFFLSDDFVLIALLSKLGRLGYGSINSMVNHYFFVLFWE